MRFSGTYRIREIAANEGALCIIVSALMIAPTGKTGAGFYEKPKRLLYPAIPDVCTLIGTDKSRTGSTILLTE